ncbi:MAG TPA: hypothetical protein EYQ50_20850 [Verrucomicrobiales bacterium]|nr:hypothetical protein [Verrucomicrobiales bacterium]HIL72222.1 hypothetical protein [Verrucomicrobiota bacterium]
MLSNHHRSGVLNLGIWSDKFIYWWFSPISEQVFGVFYAAPMYDSAVYLSFLSIVPGMSVFLIKLETDYSQAYERFFQNVLNKNPYLPLGIVNFRWSMR